MPNYDFRCDSCTAEFEVSRPLSQAREPADCPACGARARRVFSPLAVNGLAEQPGPAKRLKAGAGGWSHAGHSHGAGASGHSHGTPNPKPPPK